MAELKLKITICPPMPAAGSFVDGPFRDYPVNQSKAMARWSEDYAAMREAEESFD